MRASRHPDRLKTRVLTYGRVSTAVTVAGRSSASTCDLTISSPERQEETDNGPDHVVPREQFVGVVIGFRNDDEPLSG